MADHYFECFDGGPLGEGDRPKITESNYRALEERLRIEQQRSAMLEADNTALRRRIAEMCGRGGSDGEGLPPVLTTDV